MDHAKPMKAEIRRRRRKKKKDGDGQRDPQTEKNNVSSDEDMYAYIKTFANFLRIDDYDGTSDEDDNYFSRNRTPVPVKLPCSNVKKDEATESKKLKVNAALKLNKGKIGHNKEKTDAAGSSTSSATNSTTNQNRSLDGPKPGNSKLGFAKINAKHATKVPVGASDEQINSGIIDFSGMFSCDVIRVESQSSWSEIPFNEKCTYCLKYFQDKSEYLSHGDVCFAGIYKMKPLKENPGPPGPPSFECTLCSDSKKPHFASVVQLIDHIRRKGHLDRFACDTCKKVFATEDAVTKHCKIREKRKKSYKCTFRPPNGEVCGRQLKNMKSVFSHLMVHLNFENEALKEGDEEESEYEISNDANPCDDGDDEIFEEVAEKQDDIVYDLSDDDEDVIMKKPTVEDDSSFSKLKDHVPNVLTTTTVSNTRCNLLPPIPKKSRHLSASSIASKSSFEQNSSSNPSRVSQSKSQERSFTPTFSGSEKSSSKSQPHCYLCDSNFKNNDKLKEHVLGHQGQVYCKVVCERCNLDFDSFPNYYIHRHETHEQRIECFYCSKLKRFDKRKDYENHVQKEHNIDMCLTCSSCPSKFTRYDDLVYHARKIHGSKSFHCEFCAQGFGSKTNYGEHLKHKHGAKKPTFKCFLCRDWFCTQEELEKHEKDRHEKCRTCKKTFATKNALEGHMRNNLANCGLKCTKCTAMFPNSFQVNKHMNDCHSVHRAPSHTTFRSSNSSFDHRDITRRPHQPWINQGPAQFTSPFQLPPQHPRAPRPLIYMCQNCRKIFHRPSHHRFHSPCHVWPRSSQCQLAPGCPILLNTLDDMRNHAKIHMDVGIYCCLQCDLAFESQLDLQTHLNNFCGRIIGQSFK